MAAIDATPPERRFLRTRRHPSAIALGPEAASFDALYESASSLEDVYQGIVDALLAAAASAARAAASSRGPILYAVPGSPAVAERTVELLRQTGVDVEVLPGVSFVDLAWDRLGVDPVAVGARLIDGHRFGVEAAGSTGPLLVAQCDSSRVLSEIKLSLSSFDDAPVVTVLQRLGLPDESVVEVAWADMDRPSVVACDHLTTLWIPALAAPVGAELLRFAELIKVLREECPWDREQTHRSLSPHLLEESYETVEAISALGDDGEGAEHLEEELGDVLLQVVLHATIAAEEGWFTLADVARGIHDKMVARHPHVFGSATAETAAAVQANWEQLKAAERPLEAGGVEIGSAFAEVSGHLPALLYADGLQKAAARVGFDWSSVEGPLAKVDEELAELRTAEGQSRQEAELGDLLFACVNVSRHLGLDPEVALRAAAARFRARVRAVEERAGASLATLDLAALDVLWNEVMRDEG